MPFDWQCFTGKLNRIYAREWIIYWLHSESQLITNRSDYAAALPIYAFGAMVFLFIIKIAFTLGGPHWRQPAVLWALTCGLFAESANLLPFYFVIYFHFHCCPVPCSFFFGTVVCIHNLPLSQCNYKVPCKLSNLPANIHVDCTLNSSILLFGCIQYCQQPT